LVDALTTHRPLHSLATRRSSDLSGEPTGFRLADVEEEPGRAPPADAPEPPRPRVGEAHVEIVDVFGGGEEPHGPTQHEDPRTQRDRKSTRLNSSHVSTSYAVFCL